MPYASKKQQKFFHSAASRGEISQSTVKEWDQATQASPGGFAKLPEKSQRRKKLAAFMQDLLVTTKTAAIEGPFEGSGEAPLSAMTGVDPKLLQRLLPALLLGTAGAGYGAVQAPGKSSLRGALIGGLTGAGAGAGLVAGTELINSPYGQAGLQGGGPSAATLVGGTALGAAGGLAGGRRLSKWLGLGSERDKTENDLQELDVRLLPSGLREYVKRGVDDSGTRLHLSGSAELSPAAALLVAGLGTGLPMAYGAMTAPQGRRLHGAGSTAAQTHSALTGAALGGLAGGVGGVSAASAAGADPKSQAITGLLSALGGAGLGGYAGQQVGQAFHPGPRQLGLQERDKKVVSFSPQSKAAAFIADLCKQAEQLSCCKPSKPLGAKNWTLSLAKGKSTIRNSNVRAVATDKPVSTWADKLDKVEARIKE